MQDRLLAACEELTGTAMPGPHGPGTISNSPV
jgi:hypothetical protein